MTWSRRPTPCCLRRAHLRFPVYYINTFTCTDIYIYIYIYILPKAAYLSFFLSIYLSIDISIYIQKGRALFKPLPPAILACQREPGPSPSPGTAPCRRHPTGRARRPLTVPPPVSRPSSSRRKGDRSPARRAHPARPALRPQAAPTPVSCLPSLPAGPALSCAGNAEPEADERLPAVLFPGAAPRALSPRSPRAHQGGAARPPVIFQRPYPNGLIPTA